MRRRPDAAHTVAEDRFGFAGRRVDVVLRDGPVSVYADIDAVEHRRRSRAGLGAIDAWGDVLALWEIPAGLPIREAVLAPWVRVALRRLPAAAVSFDGTNVIRHARSPVSVLGAVAEARRLVVALLRVGQMSAICPMGVIVSDRVHSDDPGLLDAVLFGVGVVAGPDGALLTEPADVAPSPIPHRWWVAEVAYRQLLASGG